MLAINRKKIRKITLSLASIFILATVGACGQNSNTTSPTDTATDNQSNNTQGETNTTQENSNLTGDISIDGSSTVFPITQAMAEEFQKNNSNVKIAIGVSGTGGGFKKFCSGETDISNASRPIKDKEIEKCEQAGVEYIEIPIAFDALSVVVNPENHWAVCLTQEELNKIWNPEAQSKVTNWNQVRSSFPNQPINLFAPGTDSGTFDYFTEAINGEGGKSRGDYTASEDDNTIVQGISTDKGGLGYFGLSYLEENLASVKPVSIDDGDASNGDGCIEPTVANVENGTYQPLARPIFIYVKKDSLQRPEVKAFVSYYIQKDHSDIIDEIGYIHLPSVIYDKIAARIEEQKTGTVFTNGSSVGVKLDEVL